MVTCFLTTGSGGTKALSTRLDWSEIEFQSLCFLYQSQLISPLTVAVIWEEGVLFLKRHLEATVSLSLSCHLACLPGLLSNSMWWKFMSVLCRGDKDRKERCRSCTKHPSDWPEVSVLANKRWCTVDIPLGLVMLYVLQVDSLNLALCHGVSRWHLLILKKCYHQALITIQWI